MACWGCDRSGGLVVRKGPAFIGTKTVYQRCAPYRARAARGGVETNIRTMVRHSPEIAHRVVVFGEVGPMVDDWREAGLLYVFSGQVSNWGELLGISSGGDQRL